MRDINKEITKAMKKLKIELVDLLKNDEARIKVAIMVSELKTKEMLASYVGFPREQTFRLVKKYKLQAYSFPERSKQLTNVFIDSLGQRFRSLFLKKFRIIK